MVLVKEKWKVCRIAFVYRVFEKNENKLFPFHKHTAHLKRNDGVGLNQIGGFARHIYKKVMPYS